MRAVIGVQRKAELAHDEGLQQRPELARIGVHPIDPDLAWFAPEGLGGHGAQTLDKRVPECGIREPQELGSSSP